MAVSSTSLRVPAPSGRIAARCASGFHSRRISVWSPPHHRGIRPSSRAARAGTLRPRRAEDEAAALGLLQRVHEKSFGHLRLQPRALWQKAARSRWRVSTGEGPPLGCQKRRIAPKKAAAAPPGPSVEGVADITTSQRVRGRSGLPHSPRQGKAQIGIERAFVELVEDHGKPTRGQLGVRLPASVSGCPR